MSVSELNVGDKVVCILDQRFKGKIKTIYYHRNCFIYDVHWLDGEVPYDSSGCMFFGWQLKKIEEEKHEDWKDITEDINWVINQEENGYFLTGCHKEHVVCRLISPALTKITKDSSYRVESACGLFGIFKKDC